jgi:hypothetical protein
MEQFSRSQLRSQMQMSKDGAAFLVPRGENTEQVSRSCLRSQIWTSDLVSPASSIFGGAHSLLKKNFPELCKNPKTCL